MASMYDVSESCNHAFAYDTGVCMACGVSVVSARLASAKPSINQPIDPAGWDKLRAALDKCESPHEASPVEIKTAPATAPLTAAMSRPLAAEKSMRAQLLLRDDD